VTPLVVTPDVCFTYGPGQYPYSTPYRGRHEFRKHYYTEIGDLKSEGEEFACAQHIESRPEVDVWVRNIANRPRESFWIQTSTDKFYPDFVCKLKDGRYLVVEYKGAMLATTADTEEKSILGELWEKRSRGLCRFAMPTESNWAEIDAAIRR
jgi:type III restriction enzyme